MKNTIQFFVISSIFVLLSISILMAQTGEQIDINSKANELGITTTELQSILNSALRNGGGDDPLPEAIQERFFTGLTANDRFGYSVSSARDVNGDGYSDVIVGAYLNDAGGTDAGRAYIYYGGSAMDNTADVILTGASANDRFGISVSSAGDINGDGFSDVIIGADNNDAGGTDAGRAYIYYGGSAMDNTADVRLTGTAANDQFGFSVSTAGDVNGDGYSDVIVGAYLNDAGGTSAGRSYIYYGGSPMDNTEDVILTGAAAGDNLGVSVSSAGDVNGDGYSDVIVGAWANDAGGTDAGRAYIYYGGSAMDNTEDVILSGAATNDRFGFSVSSSGDVNGDGYSDIIVGAFGNDAGGPSAGRAYIYYGGSAMDNTADVTLTGAAGGDEFGWSVSSASDVNGDGYSDVIVGADGNDAGGTSAGRSYIYYGGSAMDNTADVILTGAAAGDGFGVSVSSAGDVNGDGYSDVIVGANLNDAGGTDAGRAYLYTNSLTGTDIPDEFFTGAAGGDSFGLSVSTAGDVNGDGYSDVIVGAYLNDAGGTSAGRAYIYYGGSAMDNTEDVILTGAAVDDRFGISVSSAGDVNGDGYSDVIVGAYLNDAGGTDAGRAYIYYGGSAMDNTEDVILTGATDFDNFGFSVSSGDDVNGDGYSDVIVGGPGSGRAYIYYGGSAMDNTEDVILTGAAGDYFGGSVSSAGDVNEDGYSDVIVGAYLNDTGGSNAGRAYIYYGGSAMDNTADVILTGAAAGDRFGISVSSGGDVNGDGYSDVIVGANLSDAGGTDAGRAYIYYGGLAMDNTEDVLLTGATDFDNFGYSVSTAGDVNRDGYSDVIVGAYGNDAGGPGAGRAYIYYGGSAMDNTADVILTGAAANDGFGVSVSSGGDVNGDGYSDVIVGAYGNDAGGTNAGRSYLYLSSSPPIKPRIMSVKDVPFDQGGYVFVNFVRSGYDARGESNIVTEYLIEMSNPPGINGFSWWQAGSVQPVQNFLYTFIAVTPNDSTTNSSGTYFFRVTARTADPDQYWCSNIMSGHSVDNLAPFAPLAFYAQQTGDDVHLGWQANTEPDFKDYVLYRTDDTGANPDTLDVFAVVSDTTFLDTNPLIGNSYYFLKSQDIHNNLSVAVVDSITGQTTFVLSVSVNNSWNMVSVPGINPAGQGVDTWWSGKDPAAGVFKYAGGYVQVTTTTPTEGYWMKNVGAQLYNYPAIQIVPHNDVPLALGWNLIGLYENTVPTAGLTTNPPGIITTGIFEYSGGYTTAINIVPGYGYWVKADQAGSIVGLAAPPFSKDGDVVEYFEDDWGKIILTDASGINYTLYAVTGEVDLNKYELPPMPPEGMFDIRFGSGRIAEDINSSLQTIDMSGVTYPLTVRVEGMDMRLMDETGRTVNVNLKSGEDVVISDATIQKLMVTGELLPTVYALEQNYPNPFNPSTVIEFSMPEDVSNVKLSIYNALGEKVAELVNTSLTTGKYQYQWNAKNIATGMYIYELRTDKFVSVKKMILMK